MLIKPAPEPLQSAARLLRDKGYRVSIQAFGSGRLTGPCRVAESAEVQEAIDLLLREGFAVATR